ncbi:MAG: hypothetical protein AAGK14_07490 [Verrucomicrobiota bacterium]
MTQIDYQEGFKEYAWRVALWLLVYLCAGTIAVFLSAYSLTTPEHRRGVSWDLSPLAGFVFGGPIWLISFPVIFLVCVGLFSNKAVQYLVALVFAGTLTVLIPFLLFRVFV